VFPTGAIVCHAGEVQRFSNLQNDLAESREHVVRRKAMKRAVKAARDDGNVRFGHQAAEAGLEGAQSAGQECLVYKFESA
jgi:hypothetical protein